MMRRWFAALVRDRRGVTSIEFAIVSTVLFTFLFAITEYGRAYWDYEIMEDAAVEGARCAAILSPSCASGGAYSSSTTASYVVSVAAERGLTITSSDVTATYSTTCAGQGSMSTVQISYTFHTVAPPLLPILNGKALTVTACFPHN
jgi:Flp pilus assembly protein TadG